MAITSTFLPGAGLLSVLGDSLNNTVTLSRDAAGNLLVNGGAVSTVGGRPTVANTTRMQVFGQAGDDTITLNEANGATRGRPVRRCQRRAAHRRSATTRLFGGAGTTSPWARAATICCSAAPA